MWKGDFGCAAEKFWVLFRLLGSQGCYSLLLFLLLVFNTVLVMQLSKTEWDESTAECSVHLPALLCGGARQRTGCCGALVACLDPDKKSCCWTEATNRLSLCFVCVEENVRRHVPSLKTFGVCFSWEVPVCDLTKHFFALQPLSTEA